MTLSRTWWTPLGLWLVVMAAGMALRPPLPVDETRYLAVAAAVEALFYAPFDEA